MGLMLRPSTKQRGKWERVGRWKQSIEDWVNNQDVRITKAGLVRVEVI